MKYIFRKTPAMLLALCMAMPLIPKLFTPVKATANDVVVRMKDSEGNTEELALWNWDGSTYTDSATSLDLSIIKDFRENPLVYTGINKDYIDEMGNYDPRCIGAVTRGITIEDLYIYVGALMERHDLVSSGLGEAFLKSSDVTLGFVSVYSFGEYCDCAQGTYEDHWGKPRYYYPNWYAEGDYVGDFSSDNNLLAGAVEVPATLGIDFYFATGNSYSAGDVIDGAINVGNEEYMPQLFQGQVEGGDEYDYNLASEYFSEIECIEFFCENMSFDEIKNLPCYRIDYDLDGVTTIDPVDSETVISGNTFTRPADPIANAEDGYTYTFDDWYTDYGTFECAYDFSTPPTEDITVYAKWNYVPTTLKTAIDGSSTRAALSYDYEYEAAKEDTITLASTGVDSTTNTAFSDISITSPARYAGSLAQGDTSSIIKLSGETDAGIVTTTSGGRIKSVSIKWSDVDQGGPNIIRIFGKDTAYTSVSDLYNSSSIGTEIGGLLYMSSSLYEDTITLLPSQNYQYIGIKVDVRAVYLDSITIVWDDYYTYSNVKLAFAAEIDTSTWENMILENKTSYVCDVGEVGIYLARRSKLGAGTTIEQAVKANANYLRKASTTDRSLATQEGDYYYFSSSIDVTDYSFNEKFVAAAYVVVNGATYFLQQKEVSVYDVVTAYKSNEYKATYYEPYSDEVKGSLDYIQSIATNTNVY